MRNMFKQLEIQSEKSTSLININEQLRELVSASEIREGILVVTSNHTTAAISVNEDEARLMQDIDAYMERLAPQQGGYLHNDIHLRDCPPDEPENAHAHLIAMTFGNSECLAIHEGELTLGKWQSVFMVELDGPRSRRVNVQIIGVS